MHGGCEFETNVILRPGVWGFAMQLVLSCPWF